MKKIIAAAVATAFVAPVMAADITVGGAMHYFYNSTDLSGIDETLDADDNQIFVSATTEAAHGITVTGKFTVVNDNASGTDHQGSTMTIAHPDFGTLGLGDNAGALDATGDYTDMAAAFGGFGLDGNDMAIAYTLPTIVDGLTLRASMSPRGDNYIDAGETTDVAGTAEDLEANAFSATYTAGALSIYWGSESVDRATNVAVTETTENTAYGIKYSVSGLTLALEAGTSDNVAQITDTNIAAGDDLEYQGIAASYVMGSTTLAAEKQETNEKATSSDRYVSETVFSVSQDLTNGVSVYAAMSSNDSSYTGLNAQDQTRVGVTFAF